MSLVQYIPRLGRLAYRGGLMLYRSRVPAYVAATAAAGQFIREANTQASVARENYVRRAQGVREIGLKRSRGGGETPPTPKKQKTSHYSMPPIPKVPKKSSSHSGHYSANLTKRVKATKTASYYKHFQDVYETQGKVEADYVVYVAHATFPLERAQDIACVAITRAIMAKAGFIFSDLVQTHDCDGEFKLYYRDTAADAQSINNQSIPVAQNLAQISQLVKAAIRAAFNVSASDVASRPNAILDKLEFYKKTDSTTGRALPVVMDLHLSYLDMTCLNDLKFQNSTAAQNDATAEQDEPENALQVDSVPLLGKLYEGDGAYPVVRWKPSGIATNTPIINDNTQETGISLGLSSTATSNDDWSKEPPKPSTFTNVKRSSGIKMQPGEMQYHKIEKKLNMSVSKFFSKWARVSGGLQRVGWGLQNYGMVALEKAIGLKSAANVPNIRVYYELNQQYFAYCTFGKPQGVILSRVTKNADANL